MNKIVFFLVLSLFGVFATLQAQEEMSALQENLVIKGYVSNDSIFLRWAPSNVEAWLAGQEYGYVLERHTVYINDVLQEVPSIKLKRSMFFSKPLAEWEKRAMESDYTAVIAQAFYGDEFSVYSTGSSVDAIINQSKELEQRFAVSLFMAEYDFQGAMLAGWGCVDATAKPDERYLYRIYINRPVSEPGDTAVVLIGLSEAKALPQPLDLYAVFGDQEVLLSWSYYIQADTYHSYHIERASDTDTTFRQITDIPVSVLKATDQAIFYADSLPDNTQIYRYRVRGITSFEQLGPYSEIVSGQGAKKLDCIPNIQNVEFIRPDTADVFWEYDCEDLSQIDKVFISRSEEDDGEYEIVGDSILSPQLSAQIYLPYRTNYLRVNVFMKDGSQSESFPYRAQQIDSIPPAVPVDLEAYIDTLGVAHLSWKANEEPDLRGYRVLRSFLEQEEKSSITSQLIATAEFTDTLSLNNLNMYVYYSVTALDMNYNESEPSLTLKVEKPNLSTPNDPVITSFSQEENRITLSWVTSRRDTTIVYDLIRISGDGKEETVCSGNYHQSTYTDTVPNGTYQYTVIATSRNGKRSFSPQQPTFTVSVLERLEPVSGFRFYVSEKIDYIELRWRKQPQATDYFLYKKTGDAPMVLIRELSNEEDTFVDEVITPTMEYTYVIIYSISTGQKSQPASLTIQF